MEDSPKFFVGDYPGGENSLPGSAGQRAATQDSPFSFSFDLDPTQRNSGSPVSLRAHGSTPATPKEKTFRHKGKIRFVVHPHALCAFEILPLRLLCASRDRQCRVPLDLLYQYVKK